MAFLKIICLLKCHSADRNIICFDTLIANIIVSIYLVPIQAALLSLMLASLKTALTNVNELGEMSF
jgi:hypothetical protein